MIVTLVLPRLAPPRPTPRLPATQTAAFSGPDFNKYIAAEGAVRRVLGYNQATPGLSLRERLLREAAADYRSVARAAKAPSLARRALIVDHARGAPLDDGLLVALLRGDNTKAADVAAEQALWRALYGEGLLVDAQRAGAFERKVRAMQLGFLQNQALADLYDAAGQPARAAGFAQRLQAEAQRYGSRILVLNLSLVVAFLAGIVFLTLFIRTAFDRRWPRVRRVATKPARLSGGALLDAFVFYLLLSRGVGLSLGFLSGRLFPDPATPRDMVILSAVAHVGVGVLGALYLRASARAQNARLADIGFSTRDLASNIGYGIAGYCALLPLVVVAGLLSRLLFENNPNTVPNPILPLTIAERDVGWRLLIFVLVAFSAPLFEELFFRGALFSGLRARYNWVAASAVSAALFALLHPVQDWIPIVVLGAGLATMREMRQSLVPSITAHLLQNASAFLQIALLFPAQPG